MRRFINQLMPFLLLGVAIVAFFLGIVLLAYLFLFGAIIGAVLFVIGWIRARFFPSKVNHPRQRPKSGRIIDSDDWKEL